MISLASNRISTNEDATVKPTTQFLFTASFLTLALAAPVATLQANEKVYQEVLDSVVWVKADIGGKKISTGSGVLVDAKKRWIITNNHVIGQAKDVAVVFPVHANGELIAEQEYYFRSFSILSIPGKVIYRDSIKDLAVIQLTHLPRQAHAVKMASAQAMPGQDLHVIGNPGKTGSLWVYSFGKVRQVYTKSWRAQTDDGQMFNLRAKVVETQLPINPGDSGGPVVNDQSELVALVSSFDKTAQLVSTCISLTEIRTVLARAEQAEILAQNNPGILTPQPNQQHQSFYPPTDMPPYLPPVVEEGTAKRRPR
jgi:S1-C subfamily serine protease